MAKEKSDSENKLIPSSEESDRSISVLENLLKDTEQLANLPEEQRIALLKVTGELFSFPIEKETY